MGKRLAWRGVGLEATFSPEVKVGLSWSDARQAVPFPCRIFIALERPTSLASAAVSALVTPGAGKLDPGRYH
jgi:hypothetical protein